MRFTSQGEEEMKKNIIISNFLLISFLLLTSNLYCDIIDDLGINMIFIEGGTFEMGDIWGDGETDELPIHQVTLSDYYLSATEVTNTQYCKFLNDWGNQEEEGCSWLYLYGNMFAQCLIEEKDGKYYPKSGYGNHPVMYVNWYGAVAFCLWLSEKTEDEYRLPTEAEWEYAARSGGKEDNRYAGTDDLEQLYLYCNYADANYVEVFGDVYDFGNKEHDDGFVRTAPVGNYRPNILGLYDMSGNVWEWCSDWYGSDYYNSSPINNPKGPETGDNDFRVVRGGCWIGYMNYLRCSNRYSTFEDGWFGMGFRLCRTDD